MSKSVSYSQYSQFQQCPHQWYLNQVKGLKQYLPSIFTIFGTSVHETLQNYLEVLYTKSGKEADTIDLAAYLKSRMVENFKEGRKVLDFSSPEELTEFYEDGVAILEFFKSRRREYFVKDNYELVGIEIPINAQASPNVQNVIIKGFIDLVIKNKLTGEYIIYDIKTSGRGWTDKEKKNQVKVNQVLLYKKFFSEMMNIPPDKIKVQFFVVKRKVPAQSDFPIKRIQEFEPAHGDRKVKQAYKDFTDFVETVFTPEGEYVDQPYEIKPSKLCGYCPFDNKPELCNKGKI